MDYLGIDISKRTSVIAHYFEDKFQKEFTIQNNKNGYNQLLKYLKKLNQPQLIFESTGVYSRGIVQFCQVNHVNYIEMNPLEAKFKTNSLRSWKTDHSDAHKLAQLGLTLKSTNSLNTKDEIYFELRERTRFHLEIEKNQNRLKIQIIEILHQTFPGLEKLFKSRYSMIALNIAKIYSHPSFVQQQDKDTLISNIFNSTEKGLSTRKAGNYAKKLFKIAHESYPSVKASSFLVKKFNY